MRLQIDDLVRMELDGTCRNMRVVVITSNGQMFFAEHNEANVDGRNRDKENAFSYVSKYPGSLQRRKDGESPLPK